MRWLTGRYSSRLRRASASPRFLVDRRCSTRARARARRLLGGAPGIAEPTEPRRLVRARVRPATGAKRASERVDLVAKSKNDRFGRRDPGSTLLGVALGLNGDRMRRISRRSPRSHLTGW